MSTVLVGEIVEHIEILPISLQNHVLAIVRALSRPFRTEKAQTVTEVQETAGQRLAKLAGTISPSDLDLMSQAIEEDQ